MENALRNSKLFQAVAIVPAGIVALVLGIMLGISGQSSGFNLVILLLLVVAAVPAIIVVMLLTKNGK